jgi:hypothetical protein
MHFISFHLRQKHSAAPLLAKALSHRHATRENGDIVKCTLLSSTRIFQNAEDMWKSKIEDQIATAYIMPNIPRLEAT